jgi:soluble lytic murein transglycosylase-like protein
MAAALLLATGGAGVSPAAGGAVEARAVVRADPASGRLVRRVVAPSLRLDREALRQQAGIDRLVAEAAAKYDVDPLLVHSVIRAESNYNPFAVSPKGAQGLMQLVPNTARRFGVNNSFNVSENIDAGVRYLKQLQDMFGDDRLALAAYNAGEGAVEKYHRQVPPYRETRDYVKRVGDFYRSIESPAEAQPDETLKYRPLDAYVDSEGRLHLSTR